MNTVIVLGILLAASVAAADAGGTYESDTYETSSGPLVITFLGHGSLFFSYGGTVVHVDPYGKVADYGALPAADLVLITHEHGDHLDLQALSKIRGPGTVIVASAAAAKLAEGATVLRNGESGRFQDLPVRAVPAYNIRHHRPSGEPFHPRGRGNGYVVTFGDLNVYVAGDTENVPEMKDLEGIGIAFLPMNLPYTMTPEMAADAAVMIRPRVLYPYHFGESDTGRLVELLAGRGDMEVKVRSMP